MDRSEIREVRIGRLVVRYEDLVLVQGQRTVNFLENAVHDFHAKGPISSRV